MLLPPVALVSTCVTLGVIGFLLARRRRWAALLPVVAVLLLVAAMMLKLRDPLSLTGESKRYAQTWDYVVWLLVSFVVGTVLPIIGTYFGRLGSK